MAPDAAVAAATLSLLCLTLGSHRVLRWPLLLVSTLVVAAELSAVALLVALMGCWDAVIHRFRPTKSRSQLLARLREARSWPEYLETAKSLDAEDECSRWRAHAEHPQYNSRLVRAMGSRLAAARRRGEGAALLDALGECVRKSFGGIDAEVLYSRCYAGTKSVIEEYLEEVLASLDHMRQHLRESREMEERVSGFLHRSQRVFGRTCLALSGGGGLANYSWGVARALFEQGHLPTLICGTSAGAVVAATLCTHTDAELEHLLRSERLVELLTSFEEPRAVVVRRFMRRRHMYDDSQWKPKIQVLCNHEAYPDITFAEAFALTGRELCVTVTARRRHEPPLVLSRLSSPDVTVASAVLATVAMPFLIPAQRLMRKDLEGKLHPWNASESQGCDGDLGTEGLWRDGSIMHDTPRELLAQHFGASFIIASQCNPHVVPLFIALRPTAGQPASRLQRGRSDWRGGFALSAVLVLLLSDAKKWLTFMRELEIMPLVLDTDWSSLLLQDFNGDVTIMPPIGASDYLSMLSDPTLESMNKYIRVGKRETWRKMPMLATRLRVAHALQALQNEFDQVQKAAGRSVTSRSFI
ncbi:hypothetical protein AB1Y20_006670 [Prymnesium parvum]|uniref:PNPLA domain-containing protein n=1 Tax=Prymnesium parvum TaxID=97485 RepID=A0AB34J105_PRYPA